MPFPLSLRVSSIVTLYDFTLNVNMAFQYVWYSHEHLRNDDCKFGFWQTDDKIGYRFIRCKKKTTYKLCVRTRIRFSIKLQPFINARQKFSTKQFFVPLTYQFEAIIEANDIAFRMLYLVFITTFYLKIRSHCGESERKGKKLLYICIHFSVALCKSLANMRILLLIAS